MPLRETSLVARATRTSTPAPTSTASRPTAPTSTTTSSEAERIGHPSHSTGWCSLSTPYTRRAEVLRSPRPPTSALTDGCQGGKIRLPKRSHPRSLLRCWYRPPRFRDSFAGGVMQKVLDATEPLPATEITGRSGQSTSSVTRAREDVLLRFSDEARKTFDAKMRELGSWLTAEAQREADRRQEDNISAWDIKVAVSRLREGSARSLRETLLAIGGVLLGVSLSNLTSSIFDLSSSIANIFATVAGIAGGFMIARPSVRRFSAEDYAISPKAAPSSRSPAAPSTGISFGIPKKHQGL